MINVKKKEKERESRLVMTKQVRTPTVIHMSTPTERRSGQNRDSADSTRLDSLSTREAPPRPGDAAR